LSCITIKNKGTVWSYCNYAAALLLVTIFLPVSLSLSVFAQTNVIESTTIDWYTILGTIVGISGLLSVGLTAVINHFLTKKQLKTQHKNTMKQIETQLKTQHKNTMKQIETQLKTQHNNEVTQLNLGFANTINQLKEQRQVELILDKLNLYSSFIYHLKKMTTATAFKTGIEPTDQISDTIHEIDSLLKTKFHLLSSNTRTGKNPIIEWMEVRGDHRNLYQTNRPQFEVRVNSLRQTLVDEYNQEIIPQIEQITGRFGIIKAIID